MDPSPTVECLVGYVKSALANLYDPGHLQTSPLLDLLRLRENPGGAAAVLRQWLREAVEALRPDAALPFNRPEWLGYRILALTYLQSASHIAVCQELDISHSTYYRRLQEALDAVTVIVQERAEREASSRGQRHGVATSARSEATRLVKQTPRKLVDLNTLLFSASQLMLRAAEEKGVRLEIDASASLPMSYGDPAMLRQVILNLFSEALKLASPGGLALRVCVVGDETLWRLGGLDPRRATRETMIQTPGYGVSQALLRAYGGRLWPEHAEGAGASTILSFTIPVAHPPVVLLVDDDHDTLLLYRRYLQDHYLVEQASTVDEGKARLSEGTTTGRQVDLLLLDVMMPEQDGWDFLNYIRSGPETRRVPIIVCSVLSQPELALALGAEIVLSKPVSEETLVHAISQLLLRERSAE